LGANSFARRLLKRALAPVVNETSYCYVQALAKAWDIRTGSWSEPEIDLIPYAVREGESVLDIGANFGVYCYHLSRAVGHSGRVYAFEPVPFTSATLRVVARLFRFKNVDLFEKGCGDRSARMAFRIPVQRSGAICAGQAHFALRNDDHEGKETQVRWHRTCELEADVVALDEFLPGLAELSFVKADIEGGELFAFRGARRLIERHRPSVLCEINPWFLDGLGLQVDDLTGFFFERDYVLYRYEERGGQWRLRSYVPEDIVEDNYVFIHPCRRDRFAPLFAD
jgi:FkbM family methyltransferase